MLHLILGAVVLLGGLFAAGLLMAVIGIQRGDHGKRLTGRPAGCAEAFARWMLTGSAVATPPTTSGGAREPRR
jgi:hypothetical protein